MSQFFPPSSLFNLEVVCIFQIHADKSQPSKIRLLLLVPIYLLELCFQMSLFVSLRAFGSLMKCRTLNQSYRWWQLHKP